MTGATWTGREMCFRHAPAEYGAIHFHDDDLYDCGWETDFTLEVPAGTRSGVYAVRLEGGEREDNIPFFVLPPKGKRTADICVLMSTYTYTVYHNHARPEAGTPHWLQTLERAGQGLGRLSRTIPAIIPSTASRPTISTATAAASAMPRGCGRC